MLEKRAENKLDKEKKQSRNTQNYRRRTLINILYQREKMENSNT